MSGFKLIAIHILPDCPNYIRKVLDENEWYFFNKKYKVINGILEKNNSYKVPENFFSDKINIQAIVGKNGSGKSSVIEIVLRLINNLAYKLIAKAKTDTKLHFVDNLNAEIYFEIDNVLHYLKCFKNKVYLNQGNGLISAGNYTDIEDDFTKNTIGENVPINTAISLLRNFFFTIVNNYSFHAYNANDFIEEFEDREHVWINGLFHKNDGYLTPLVLNPFRDNGRIDTEKEKVLTNIRLASLFYIFNKEQIDFIYNYKFESLSFSLNIKHLKDKFLYYPKRNGKQQRNKIEKILNIKKDGKDVFNITLKCYFDSIIEDKNFEYAYKYLVYKTYSISGKYPNYKRFINFKMEEFNKYCKKTNIKKIQSLVDKIKNDLSHVTLKIRQTLKFIDFLLNNKDFNIIKLDEKYIEYTPKDLSIFKLKMTVFNNLIANFPPPFFNPTICLINSKNEFVTFEKMSSGERQFLFYMSTILYHLKNIDSVIKDSESVHYKFVNIILEEVELYFHPEYQRVFVDTLIKYLEACKFANIEYFNILIATHSPFILSDIPNDNIMFLEDGKQLNDTIGMVTFGANIHELLKHGFFLKDGLIGEFAKNRIRNILEILKNSEINNNCSPESLQMLIDLVGEPLIRDRLQSIFNEKNKTNEVERLKKIINQLKANIK